MSKSSTPKKKNFKNLSLSPGISPSSPAPSSADSDASRGGAVLENDNDGDIDVTVVQFKAETLEHFKTSEFVPDDIEVMAVLGRGVSGVVEKVRHVPTGAIMARKLIHLELRPAMRKQITTELKILYEVKSDHVVGFYGSCFTDADLSIFMEFMDAGSLDTIYRRIGSIPEDILALITRDLLTALDYLQTVLKIIHRDVKPSNVLMNTQGQVKMCDFGVSGQLVDSLANTFVGTRSYMAPERLIGATYAIQSDSWSLGLSVMEMAIGRFPIPPDGCRRQLAIFELLQYIVTDEAPALPASFSSSFQDFIALCLLKDPSKRPSPRQLLGHPWIAQADSIKVDIAQWAKDVLRSPLPE